MERYLHIGDHPKPGARRNYTAETETHSQNDAPGLLADDALPGADDPWGSEGDEERTALVEQMLTHFPTYDKDPVEEMVEAWERDFPHIPLNKAQGRFAYDDGHWKQVIYRDEM